MIDLYYAEDDPNIANTVKEYLEQKDFKVTIYDTLASIKQALGNPCAGNGSSGLEYAGWTRGLFV